MTGWTGKRGRKLKSKLEKTKQKVKSMARELYDDHFKAVESMPRGVVVTLRNISTQLESAWELHTNRQVHKYTKNALLLYLEVNPGFQKSC